MGSVGGAGGDEEGGEVGWRELVSVVWGWG